MYHDEQGPYITNRLNQANNINATYYLTSVSNLSIKLDKPKQKQIYGKSLSHIQGHTYGTNYLFI